jgi:predicted transcriptional regulator
MPKQEEQLAQSLMQYTTQTSLKSEDRIILERAADIILGFIHPQMLPVQNAAATALTDKYISADDVAELFGITPQGVYKWIHKGKIKVEKVISPGGTKNMILRDQFKDPKYQKQIETVRKMKESLKAVKPVERESDLYPVSDDDSDMEELDVR